MSTQPERQSTKPAHTPGPWSYQPNGHGWNNLCGADGRSIWTASALTGEDVANRSLIATAPELLAALKLIVEHFGDPLQVARAAIAKAEGR